MTEQAPKHEFDQNEAIREQVTKLIELDDVHFEDALPSFVNGRLEELKATDEAQQQSLNIFTRRTTGFIGPNTRVGALGVGITDGFLMNDDSFYPNAVRNMRKSYADLHPQVGAKRAYLTAALYAAQDTQQGYFEGVHVDERAQQERRELYAQAATVDFEGELTVADFKRKALCMERAAVANNVLQLLGEEPVFEIGEIDRNRGSFSDHAFLRIKNTQGKDLIFDPTNPTLTFDETGNKLVATGPALYPVGEVDFTQPGTEVTGQYKEYEMDNGQRQLREQVPYIFRSSTLPINLIAAS